ncbi:hypothetical protein [Streptomyces sp. NBC_01185]|uniref:hypothetical protein n=1 Tax=Streptomyces sp. NBC_01185 TaxID=2903764 RepID=UPI003867FC8E|nr:hypothetical protein OG770_24255 [Streptomyces sp. NBC_01185]
MVEQISGHAQPNAFDGPPEALPDGLCRRCRTSTPDADADTAASNATAEVPADRDINATVANLRNLMRTP